MHPPLILGNPGFEPGRGRSPCSRKRPPQRAASGLGVMRSHFQNFLCFFCMEQNTVPAGHPRFLQAVEFTFVRAVFPPAPGLLIACNKPCRKNPCQRLIVHHATRYSQQNLTSAAGATIMAAAQTAIAAITSNAKIPVATTFVFFISLILSFVLAPCQILLPRFISKRSAVQISSCETQLFF